MTSTACLVRHFTSAYECIASSMAVHHPSGPDGFELGDYDFVLQVIVHLMNSQYFVGYGEDLGGPLAMFVFRRWI
jgi:hypothetical protein